MQYELDFLAVGSKGKSGDAIAIRFGNLNGPRSEQTVVVVDGGFAEDGDRLVDHIRRTYRTGHVDLVISSHPDADHINGLKPVLEELTVSALWMHKPWDHAADIRQAYATGNIRSMTVRAEVQRSLEAAFDIERLARRKGIPVSEPFTGSSAFQDRLVVLGPSKSFYREQLANFRGTPVSLATKAFGATRSAVDTLRAVFESWDIETLTDEGETSAENNSSTILLFRLGGRQLMLTADAGAPALNLALHQLDIHRLLYPSERLSFVQVPHHGSARNVGPTVLDRWIGKVKPFGVTRTTTAFVSAASDGAPKHPSKRVLNAFTRRGCNVHTTAGMSLLHSHGVGLRAGYGHVEAAPLHMLVEED